MAAAGGQTGGQADRTGTWPGCREGTGGGDGMGAKEERQGMVCAARRPLRDYTGWRRAQRWASCRSFHFMLITERDASRLSAS
ncbi:hypothetical protein E2C01_060105 [Portunus trituberculatus]|uniref:Uncharacterized protein n=1 Tax=Portunus trituberculatus TaxID=210409 RepID=A0A5B7HB46_PORTR|nr:hypothetical protein [Portunus trituberculatus]